MPCNLQVLLVYKQKSFFSHSCSCHFALQVCTSFIMPVCWLLQFTEAVCLQDCSLLTFFFSICFPLQSMLVFGLLLSVISSYSKWHCLTVSISFLLALLWIENSHIHRVSQNCAKLFLSELLQISTTFDNFWQKDGKEAKIMQGALILHLS